MLLLLQIPLYHTEDAARNTDSTRLICSQKETAMYQKTGYLDEQFRLFYLADQTPRKFSYHYHDFDKVILFFQGLVQYEIEGKSYALQPFDIVLVRRGQVHRPIIENTALYERIIAYLSPSFFSTYDKEGCDLSAIFTQSASPVLRQPQEVGSIYGASCRLRQAWISQGRGAALLQRTIFLEFLIHLARSMEEHHIGYVKTGRQNEKIQSVLAYINNHLTEDLSVPAISRRFYISTDYLMHLFKDETGYSLGAYITTKRLLLARQFIQDGTPVTTACYDCGFKTYSSFYRAWKHLFHNPPGKGLQHHLLPSEILD